jgi:maleylacetate reductase
LFAVEGIRALARSLPIVNREADNLDARSDALYGAWLAGAVLGSVGMAIHHNISHVLGGAFNLPHANVHSIVLPHAMAFNSEAAREPMRRIAESLGAENAAQAIYDLASSIGAPLALKDIGMPQEGLDRAAQLVCEHPYYNPRPVEYLAVRQLLENAYRGLRPSLAT